jgi:hypothetical protein
MPAEEVWPVSAIMETQVAREVLYRSIICVSCEVAACLSSPQRPPPREADTLLNQFPYAFTATAIPDARVYSNRLLHCTPSASQLRQSEFSCWPD